MTKRPDLAEVAAAAGSTRSMTPPPEPSGEKRTELPRAKTRSAGTKQIAGHFPGEVAGQRRERAVERVAP